MLPEGWDHISDKNKQTYSDLPYYNASLDGHSTISYLAICCVNFQSICWLW